MKGDSVVAFSGKSRIHIGLAVSDLARSTAFYRILLGVEPSKQRPGYAKFEPAEPLVNLSLNQVSDAQRPQSPLQHYGVQVKNSEEVSKAAARLSRAGFETSLEQETTCCYAVQDKVWVSDPDENRWEVFVVLDNEASSRKDESSECCSGAHTTSCC